MKKEKVGKGERAFEHLSILSNESGELGIDIRAKTGRSRICDIIVG